MTISFSGLVSGMNTDSMLSQLMELEKKPIQLLETQKNTLNTEKQAYDDLNSRLKILKNKNDVLFDQDIFGSVKAASSDTSILTASADTDAAIGTYNFNVTTLATASVSSSSSQLNTKISTKSTAQVVAGTGTIDTSKSFANAGFEHTLNGDVTIQTDLAGPQTFTLSNYSTVDDFMNAVNSSGLNVTLSYNSTKDQFVIEANDNTISSITLSESGTTPFFAEANITAGAGTVYNTNDTGINPSDKLQDANFDTTPSGTGNFTINGESISYDSSTDTLNSIISKINSSNANVSAFYDDTIDKVVITSKDTGDEPIVIEDVAGNLANNVLNLPTTTPGASLGKNASFTINGSDPITADSNTYTFNGITVNFVDTGNASVTVSEDTDAVANGIKDFVDQYNSVVDFIEEKTKYNSDTQEAGELLGESLVTSIKNKLNSTLSDRYINSISDIQSLADIGITLQDFASGSAVKFDVDMEKLKDAIETDPNGVAALFAYDSDSDGTKDQGISAILDDYLNEQTKTLGVLDQHVDSIDGQIETIDDRISFLNDMLETRYDTLKRQFDSMEVQLAQYKSQSAYLSQQLGSTALLG